MLTQIYITLWQIEIYIISLVNLNIYNFYALAHPKAPCWLVVVSDISG